MASEQKSAAGDNIGPGSSNVNSSKSSKDDPKYSDISDAADGAGTSHKKDRGGKSSEGKHSKPHNKSSKPVSGKQKSPERSRSSSYSTRR